MQGPKNKILSQHVEKRIWAFGELSLFSGHQHEENSFSGSCLFFGPINTTCPLLSSKLTVWYVERCQTYHIFRHPLYFQSRPFWSPVFPEFECDFSLNSFSNIYLLREFISNHCFMGLQVLTSSLEFKLPMCCVCIMDKIICEVCFISDNIMYLGQGGASEHLFLLLVGLISIPLHSSGQLLFFVLDRRA